MARRPFDSDRLLRLRALPLRKALDTLGLHVARDRDFTPVKNARTERWVVSADPGVFELLVTGQKWFDPRSGTGGGGAIDLVMHVLGVDFVQAVKRLDAKGAPDRAFDS